MKSYWLFVDEIGTEQSLGEEIVASYIAHIKEYCTPETVERRISTLRVFLDYLLSRGRIPYNYVKRIKSPISKFYVSIPADLLKKADAKGLNYNELLISAIERELAR